MPFVSSPCRRLAFVVMACGVLAGCDTFQRLSEVGSGLALSPIQNPVENPGYRPVSLPMPAPVMHQSSANSLWRPGARAFFKDQRAAEVGDILTVMVRVTDGAKHPQQHKQPHPWIERERRHASAHGI